MSSHIQSILLYDGLCGLCDGVVQFIVARDRQRTLKFATLQGDFAQSLMERHAELRTIDSLILVQLQGNTTNEIVLVRSDAAIAIAQYLGGFWSIVATVVQAVPKRLRDFGYNIVARVRFRIFGRRVQCRLPDEQLRARFLD